MRKLDWLCGVILIPYDCIKCQLGLESSEGSTGLDVVAHVLAEGSSDICLFVASSALWSQGGWASHVMAALLKVYVPRASGGS